MKFISTSKGKILSSVIAGLLAFSFILAPVSQTLEVKRVEAISFFCTNCSTWMQDIPKYTAQFGTWVSGKMTQISSAATALGVDSLVTKEYILDTIVWPLVNILIRQMIRSTTDWVRSGFKGSPAFVTDLQGFLLDVADIAAGQYLWGAGLGFLCSPFKLKIQLALHFQYQSSKRIAECRLTDMVGNVNNFLAGGFSGSGGWQGWQRVTLTPSNNPFGAALQAQAGLEATIRNSRGEQIDLLKMGNGFFSKMGIDGIVAPGKVIQDELNHALGLPGDRLVVADEINELVGALLSQLAMTALGGAGGLLGMGSQPYRSNGNLYNNYYDAVAAERPLRSPGAPTGVPTIQTVLDTELKYLNFQSTIVSLITDASLYRDRVYGANSCSAMTLTTSLANQLAAAQQQVPNSTTVITALRAYITDFTLLQSTTTPVTTLEVLYAKYEATSIPDAQGKIMEQYLQFQTSGQLHTAAQLVQLEMSTIPDLKTEIAAFTASIDTAETSCSAQNNNTN